MPCLSHQTTLQQSPCNRMALCFPTTTEKNPVFRRLLRQERVENMQMWVLFIYGLNLWVPNNLTMVSALPTFHPNPTCILLSKGQKVMVVVMMMSTWLIEILKHTWLRFNSSGLFYSLVQAPPIPMTLQHRYVTSSFTWWGTEARQWRVLLECKFRNSGRAFRKFPHSSPFCFCFSLKQRWSNSVDCVFATSFLVCDFSPQGLPHLQMQVFQRCFVEAQLGGGERPMSSSMGRKIVRHSELHY